MLNIKDLGKAVKQIAEEKGLEPGKVFEAIEFAIATAYKKEYGTRGEIIKAKLDPHDGSLTFWREKTVVDDTTVRFMTPEEEEQEKLEAQARAAEGPRARDRHEVPVEEEGKLPRYNAERHLMLDEAKAVKGDASVGDVLTFPLEAREDFGRIAAQAAKQVVLQRLRESERNSILDEWRGREGTIVSGIVQRYERGHVYIDFGRTTGVMFANESIPGEHYRNGERLRFYVLAVQEDTRMPGIILSRSHPNFIRKLFELEVPELAEGTCEIQAVAREAGSRTKIAVSSNMQGVDPVGAFVGQRGTRVMAVTNELGPEKIDIIQWSESPDEFLAHALSPAKVTNVEILERREARVYVPDDQLSLAIGKGGQNVRLAAKLTGWKIDVRSQSKPEEVQEGGVAHDAEGGVVEGAAETADSHEKAELEVAAAEKEKEVMDGETDEKGEEPAEAKDEEVIDTGTAPKKDDAITDFGDEV
jgi:N utilization substance protein A